MVSHLPTTIRDCEGVHRRDLLKVGLLGGLGLTLPGLFARRALAREAHAKEVSCIVIWTRGGTSHHDTFDPKPDATQSVRGEYGVIRTTVPGVQFADILPRMARNLNRYALLRSWNPKNGTPGTPTSTSYPAAR